MTLEKFNYSDERFADLQMLRYRLKGFEQLSLQQKRYIYYLAEATLCGRDITFDQFGKYNLRIRKMLEAVYENGVKEASDEQAQALKVYLKRLWFSNGIHHHYGGDKFKPEFTPNYLKEQLIAAGMGNEIEQIERDIFPVIFDPERFPKRVNKADGQDIVATSAVNYYENVTQQEAENFYAAMSQEGDNCQPSWGLNSKLVKKDGQLVEQKWTASDLYAPAIQQIIGWLNKAMQVAENEQQRKIISLLIDYYRTGDLKTFDEYSIEWLKDTEGMVDFINGFIEVYEDPIGLKGSWEGLVEYKDLEATRRTKTISDNAQWFEDHSPVDERFKKKTVKGVTANVICAAMLGGDEYPSSAIGINLPNADWIRAQHGSKSVTIGNLTEAYNQAAKGNGFNDEFVIDAETRALLDQYDDQADDLHTDLHECLGHGSGQLLPGTDPNALGAYASVIEEARADLFALYYMADDKMLELNLLPSPDAYKAEYYSYLMVGLLTQYVRIKPGHQIEEAHMRNRALIARWAYEHADGAIELKKIDGKTYVAVNDYARLRGVFADLLCLIQRIKSEGDYETARQLVENYGVKIDSELHKEVLERYEKLHLAPYKGFINPWLKPKTDTEGNLIDVEVDYTESYDHQMLRYSRDYGFLI